MYDIHRFHDVSQPAKVLGFGEQKVGVHSQQPTESHLFPKYKSLVCWAVQGTHTMASRMIDGSHFSGARGSDIIL
jgi:hypothetical protein